MRSPLVSIATVGLLSLCAVPAAQASSILIDTQSFGGATYEFFYNRDGITWNEANSEADALPGGMLAVMETSAENDFVAGVVATHTELYNSQGLGPWLGGFSPSTNAPFQWVNGASFGAGYTPPWQSGQPDWAEPAPEGLLYFNGGPGVGSNWGDYGAACGVTGATSCNAGNVLGYVVEFDNSIASVPEPTSILLLGTGLAIRVVRRRLTERA